MKHRFGTSMVAAISGLAATALLAQTPPAQPGSQTQPATQTRPRGGTASTPAAPVRTAPSPLDLKYPALHTMEVPKAATFTLSNGMKVMLLEDHDLPVIRGDARIRTGNLFDPEDKAGLAEMTGMVLRSGGTREMTGEQLNLRLDDMAAAVDASIGESQADVAFFSLAENASDILTIFRDVLTGPVFRAEQIDRARVLLGNAIAHRNDDAKTEVTREFRNLIYGTNTPYGRMMGYDSLNGIRRSDLLAFYKRYFFPKNTILAICGDFDSAKMKEQVETIFGGWTAEQPPVPEFPKAATQAAPGIHFAKNTNTSDAFFSVGHLGGLMNDKDYAALTLMTNILGSGSASRVSLEVRGRMGSGYGIAAEWAAGFDHPGVFSVSGNVRGTSTVATLKAVQQAIDGMRTNEPTDDELRRAKDRALNALVFGSDTRRKVLEETLNLAYFGYPENFMQQYQKALAAVTKADVARVAKEYLRPAELTIVVAGNPVEFVPALDALGPVHDIDVAIPDAKSKPAPADPGSLERGKQILARMQQALGGAEKLAAVKDYTVVRDVRFAAAAGGNDIVETEKWMAPGNVREESESATTRNALYCDGKSGWVSRGRSTAALRGPQLKSAQDDVFRSFFTLMLSDRAAGRSVNALDTDLIEITTAEGQAVQVTINPETGLPFDFSYQVVGTSGPAAVIREIVTKYGDVGGVKAPFEVSTKQNGMDYTTSVVKSFQVNTGLVLADLERRP